MVRKWACRSSMSEQADLLFIEIKKLGKSINKVPRLRDCSETRISGDTNWLSQELPKVQGGG